jgi:hypothetical protein
MAIGQVWTVSCYAPQMSSLRALARLPAVLALGLCTSGLACTNDYDLLAPGPATGSGAADGQGGSGAHGGGTAASSSVAAGGGGASTTGGGGEGGRSPCAPTRVGPARAAAHASRQPKSIDGNLDDWGCSEPLLLDAASAAVAYSAKDRTPVVSVHARLEWDDGYLYFAAEVIDPTPGDGNDSAPYMNDSVELYLRGSTGADANYSPIDHHFIVDHAGRKMEDSPPLVELETDPAGFEAAALPWAEGYRIEARVDAAVLGGPWQAGRTLGFDLLVSDGEAQVEYLIWALGGHGPCGECSGQCCCNQGGGAELPSCNTLVFGDLDLL